MKFIDIKKPIPHKPKHIHYDKNKKSNKNSGVFLLFIIFLAVILFLSLNNSQNTNYSKDTHNIDNIDELATNTPENSLDTKNPESSPSPSISSEKLSEDKSDKYHIFITILNGAAKAGLAQEIKNILLANNFNIETIGNASNIYTKTIIYCSDTNIDIAKEIQSILQYYPSEIETGSNLSDDNHITIVMGEETI